MHQVQCGGGYKQSWLRSNSSLYCNLSTMEGADAAAQSTKNSCRAAKRKRKNRRQENKKKWRKKAEQKCFGCLSKGCTTKSDFQEDRCGEFANLFYFSLLGNVMHIRSI